MGDSDYYEFDYDALKTKADQLYLDVCNGNLSYVDDDDLEEIIEFWLEEDEAQKALDICEAALILYPNNSAFILQKADSLVELDRFEEAKEILDNNVFIDHFDSNYFILQSEIAIKQNKMDEAKAILIEAIDICEEELDNLYLQLADVYEIEEDYANVLLYLKKSIEENIENEEAFNRLWFCVELTESHQESIEFHNLIIENHPYCINAWYNISHAYSSIGDLDKAIESLEFVLAIDSNFDIAYLDCAELYFEKQMFEKALEYYHEAEKIFKQHKDTYNNIGMCYFFLDDQIKARLFFRKAIAQDNEYAESYFRIAVSYRKENKFSLAEEAFNKALSIDSENIIFLQFGADFYLDNEEYEKSNEFLINLIEQNNSTVGTWVNLAMNFFNLGLYKQALDALDQADLYYPDSYFAKCSKFLLFYRMGRNAESMNLLGDILGEDTSFVDIIFEHLPEALDDIKILQIIELHSKK